MQLVKRLSMVLVGVATLAALTAGVGSATVSDDLTTINNSKTGAAQPQFAPSNCRRGVTARGSNGAIVVFWYCNQRGDYLSYKAYITCAHFGYPRRIIRRTEWGLTVYRSGTMAVACNPGEWVVDTGVSADVLH
jgi:hypothetical protein